MVKDNDLDPREFIVAEVSTNWPKPWPVYPRDCLGGKFEEIINANLERGYRLHSFQLHQLLTSAEVMTETIVAVFEKVPT
jgi:hypothetical protein